MIVCTVDSFNFSLAVENESITTAKTEFHSELSSEPALVGNARTESLSKLIDFAAHPPEHFEFMSAQRVNIQTATFFEHNKSMPCPSVFEHHASRLLPFSRSKTSTSMDIVMVDLILLWPSRKQQVQQPEDSVPSFPISRASVVGRGHRTTLTALLVAQNHP